MARISIKQHTDSTFLIKTGDDEKFQAKPKVYELLVFMYETPVFVCRKVDSGEVLFQEKISEIEVNGTIYDDSEELSKVLAPLVFSIGGGSGSGAANSGSNGSGSGNGNDGGVSGSGGDNTSSNETPGVYFFKNVRGKSKPFHQDKYTEGKVGINTEIPEAALDIYRHRVIVPIGTFTYNEKLNAFEYQGENDSILSSSIWDRTHVFIDEVEYPVEVISESTDGTGFVFDEEIGLNREAKNLYRVIGYNKKEPVEFFITQGEYNPGGTPVLIVQGGFKVFDDSSFSGNTKDYYNEIEDGFNFLGALTSGRTGVIKEIPIEKVKEMLSLGNGTETSSNNNGLKEVMKIGNTTDLELLFENSNNKLNTYLGRSYDRKSNIWFSSSYNREKDDNPEQKGRLNMFFGVGSGISMVTGSFNSFFGNSNGKEIPADSSYNSVFGYCNLIAKGINKTNYNVIVGTYNISNTRDTSQGNYNHCIIIGNLNDIGRKNSFHRIGLPDESLAKLISQLDDYQKISYGFDSSDNSIDAFSNNITIGNRNNVYSSEIPTRSIGSINIGSGNQKGIHRDFFNIYIGNHIKPGNRANPQSYDNIIIGNFLNTWQDQGILAIHNSTDGFTNVQDALIYGGFRNRFLNINGKLNINPTYMTEKTEEDKYVVLMNEKGDVTRTLLSDISVSSSSDDDTGGSGFDIENYLSDPLNVINVKNYIDNIIGLGSAFIEKGSDMLEFSYFDLFFRFRGRLIDKYRNHTRVNYNYQAIGDAFVEFYKEDYPGKYLHIRSDDNNEISDYIIGEDMEDIVTLKEGSRNKISVIPEGAKLFTINRNASERPKIDVRIKKDNDEYISDSTFNTFYGKLSLNGYLLPGESIKLNRYTFGYYGSEPITSDNGISILDDDVLISYDDLVNKTVYNFNIPREN